MDQDTHAEKAKTGQHADDVESDDEGKEDSDDEEEGGNVKDSAKKAVSIAKHERGLVLI